MREYLLHELWKRVYGDWHINRRDSDFGKPGDLKALEDLRKIDPEEAAEIEKCLDFIKEKRAEGEL